MEDEQLVPPDHDIRTQLETLANEGGGVHFPDFTRLILDGSAEITPSECWEIFQFACDQLGFWETEWSFSLVDSPNHAAELEVKGWKTLCQNLLNSLVEQMPDQRAVLEKSKHQTVLLHLLTRRVEFNEGKPFTKLTAFVLSKMSFIFNRLGFHRIAWFRQLDLAHFDTFIWPTPEPVFWIESFNKAEQSSTSGSTPLIFQPSSFYHEPASKMRVAGGG